MLHVVAVEDDADSAWLFLMKLHKAGVAYVTGVANFEVATAGHWLWSHEPTTAVIDLMMPRADGVEVARWLKEHHPSVRRIMLTAAFEDDPRLKEAAEFCHRVLFKAETDADELLQAVRHDG